MCRACAISSISVQINSWARWLVRRCTSCVFENLDAPSLSFTDFAGDPTADQMRYTTAGHMLYLNGHDVSGVTETLYRVDLSTPASPVLVASTQVASDGTPLRGLSQMALARNGLNLVTGNGVVMAPLSFTRRSVALGGALLKGFQSAPRTSATTAPISNLPPATSSPTSVPTPARRSAPSACPATISASTSCRRYACRYPMG